MVVQFPQTAGEDGEVSPLEVVVVDESFHSIDKSLNRTIDDKYHSEWSLTQYHSDPPLLMIMTLTVSPMARS